MSVHAIVPARERCGVTSFRPAHGKDAVTQAQDSNRCHLVAAHFIAVKSSSPVRNVGQGVHLVRPTTRGPPWSGPCRRSEGRLWLTYRYVPAERSVNGGYTACIQPSRRSSRRRARRKRRWECREGAR